MNKILKKFFKKIIQRIFDIGLAKQKKNLIELSNQTIQVSLQSLAINYRYMLQEGKNLPKFNEVGFKIFSQTDEDGILHYIFSLIGTHNKQCFDIAFESPYGSNTANLICNGGWTGLLVCSSDDRLQNAQTFFEENPHAFLCKPTLAKAWITTENINSFLEQHGVTGTIDLFSLDIDGVDYWLWKHLEVITPRVVVVEYANIWNQHTAVTVPYDPFFNRLKFHNDYYGASLAAFVQLGREKGYRLVGCNKLFFNAFFIKNGIGDDIFPEVSIHDCLPPQSRDNRSEQTVSVAHLPWVNVAKSNQIHYQE